MSRPQIPYELLRPKLASRTVGDNNRQILSPRTFATANKSRRRRACQQVTVGICLSLLMLWPLFFYGLPAGLLSVFFSSSGTTAIEFCRRSSNEFSFIEPTIVMGNFTLGQAKTIDLCWNTVIGRGGQAIMGYASYNAVSSALLRIAEVTPVTYDLFASLSLNPNDWFTIIDLVKGVRNLQGWRPKFAMFWLLFSAILIIAMPSIIDASTGYVQPLTLFYVSGDVNDTHGPEYNPTERIPDALRVGEATDVEYICKTSTIYQWGFSRSWFMIIMALIPVWFFGTYCLWLDAQHNSELTRKMRNLGQWRTIADLSEAMTAELGPHINGYSDKELAKVLKSRPAIKYDVQVDEQGINHIFLTPRHSSKLKLSFEATYG